MIQLTRSNSTNADFRALVNLLDQELRIRDGEEHSFFHQFNQIDHINEVVLAYSRNQAIGCGAIKAYDATSMEVKRLFVLPEFRGKKVAAAVLSELESWARELGYTRCILETGIKQSEAIRLYQREHYQRIANYGPYVEVSSSRCFEKFL